MDSRDVRVQLDGLAGHVELAFPVGRVSPWSTLDRVWLAWDEAETEAELAYQEWRLDPDAYFVYRAAQDRADAAQDALARSSSQRTCGSC